MDARLCIRVSAAALYAAAILLPSSVLAQRNLSIAPTAANEQRVALVIGNANYEGEARLKNPRNDASDTAEALRALGFQVTAVLDANRVQMRRAIRDFTQNLRRGGVGLFYYAGHGIESKGKNFMIPIGADITEELDLEDQALNANMVLEGMEDAGNRVNIVVLDACRNNPLTRGWRSAAQGGLAQMSAPRGSFVAFATSPNNVAADGNDRNGTFTKHLLANLRQGDSNLDSVFTRVTKAVADETRNKQIPWRSSNLTDIFRFRNDEPVATIGRIDPVEQAQWNAIKASSDPHDFDKFLSSFPNGAYGEQARDYKTRLMQDLEKQAHIDAETRRLRDEDNRLKRQREIDRQKAEQDKKRKGGVYVAPTF